MILKRKVLPESGSRKARMLVQKTRLPIQSIILRTLFATGAIGVALVAPNALRLFKGLDEGKERRKRLYGRLAQARERLERKGLVRLSGFGTTMRVELTDRGVAIVERILVNDYTIPEPTFWDGRWRIIVFDVREKRRRIRSALRQMLSGAGCVRLQDSVWVHPYPCDDFVELVRANLRSGVGELLFFVTEPFVGDTTLRRHFNL
jgi:CRISPR/Cas system-associated endoribonuclease Cas2